eukprot:jgi/Orpsp1_1/1191814/evm.model.d7180000088678.1
MDTLKDFNEKFPTTTKELKNGKSFTYRYYKNPSAKATILMLVGGIGLSDLMYSHFERYSKEYSVITFDYQIQFETVKEQMDAIAEILTMLNEKVWLNGQSLGGIMSEIFAKQYPDLVEGMILSNTCALPKDMPEESYNCLIEMLKSQKTFKIILKIVPLFLLKKLMKNSIIKMGKNSSENEKVMLNNMADLTNSQLTKEYEYHMVNLLLECEKYMDMVPEDFKKWDDKVLLLLSEDDNTFNESCKKDLSNIMTNPTVITNITGGHLALMINMDKYIEEVNKYINKRVSL